MNKKAKIVMIAMFKNEAQGIGKMLESCYKYIDYYVLQDNGSTDGTPEIVKAFFKDKNIPGFIYQVEEGWVGFGWNRDHLIQKCQNTEHGCDWILKMDCDEELEVLDDFDWSVLDDTTIQSFNVVCKQGTSLYFRTWLWNSRLPWRFNHDIAHETIYLDKDNIGQNFQRVNLPSGFRHIHSTRGESWTVPTKFISDSLKIEEKLIREQSMLENIYHFWYIGKSYFDCCFNVEIFPLKEKHSVEYARRALFYFENYVDFLHKDFFITKKSNFIDEISYLTVVYMGVLYKFLKNYDKAFECYQISHHLCPPRNDHFIELMHLYNEIKDYKTAIQIADFLLKSERKNPFPQYEYFINLNHYYDTSDYILNFKESLRLKNNA